MTRAEGGNPRVAGRHAATVTPGLDADDRAAAVVVLVLALVVAVSLALVGSASYRDYVGLRDHGRIVTAVVVDADPGGRGPASAQFRYQVGGQTHTRWSDEYEGGLLEVGSELPLVVDASDPGNFVALDWGVDMVNALLLWVAAGASMLVALVSGATLLIERWLRRAGAPRDTCEHP